MTTNWSVQPPDLSSDVSVARWAASRLLPAAPAHEIHRVTTAGARVGHRSPQSRSRRWTPGTHHRHLRHYGQASTWAQGPLSLSTVSKILISRSMEADNSVWWLSGPGWRWPGRGRADSGEVRPGSWHAQMSGGWLVSEATGGPSGQLGWDLTFCVHIRPWPDIHRR